MQRILSTVWLSVLAGSAAMSLAACDDESLEALDGELAEDEAIDGDLAVAEDEQSDDVFEFTPPKKGWPEDLAMAPRGGDPEDTLAAPIPPDARPAGLTTPPMTKTPPHDAGDAYAAFHKPPVECICTDEKQPVCGVDGETYQNSCAAVCSGVEVEHEGACEEEGCFCTLEYNPVCGVDGKTYGNACAAGCADVDIEHEGTCEAATCMSDDECSPLEFCERDMVCGGPGTCEAKPDACADKSAPVCGCDGQVYDSPCMAHVHGVSVGPDDSCEIEDEPEEPTPDK